MVRNRRFKYIEQLEREGDYFSLDNMKIRQPELYQEYVGQYEKGSQRPFPRNTPLYERLLHNCDLANAQHTIDNSMEEEQEEEETDSDESEEEPENTDQMK
jgi:hypothetical protein